MHPKRKQRLILVTFIVVLSSTVIGLSIYAMRDNFNLFYPPSAIVKGEAPVGKTIRAGGCVVPGSLVRSKDSLVVDFKVTDGIAELAVMHDGILPDLFGEGEAAVLTGQLNTEGVFIATKVLAKHDETYTPPEVADTVQTNGEEHTATCKGLSYDS
ncbi:cytochrome c maturation protein CcmE [Teredinibacter purpureus]|jgi:Cytochrome c-type biogenesis protein CcmE|uniref:cytochrome c maturation protein CcmE n=1 Tax=Teredinibacter purpureus TaxID=2731756 RepID=UPI0005F81E77|nr:cytochrome c maturation protein CcmE [Teredinibacter purpureus]